MVFMYKYKDNFSLEQKRICFYTQQRYDHSRLQDIVVYLWPKSVKGLSQWTQRYSKKLLKNNQTLPRGLKQTAKCRNVKISSFLKKKLRRDSLKKTLLRKGVKNYFLKKSLQRTLSLLSISIPVILNLRASSPTKFRKKKTLLRYVEEYITEVL